MTHSLLFAHENEAWFLGRGPDLKDHLKRPPRCDPMPTITISDDTDAAFDLAKDQLSGKSPLTFSIGAPGPLQRSSIDHRMPVLLRAEWQCDALPNLHALAPD